MQSAPKPCGHPGCGVLVRDGTNRCPKHPKANSFADKARGNRHQRGYGTAWDKLRAQAIARDEGLCQPCERVRIRWDFAAICPWLHTSSSCL